ncbi:MAG: threonine aldolase family protein [Verrucomicrobiales bacterium]
MNFNSDNWAGAHPSISESLAIHGEGMASAYGSSTLDKKVEKIFEEIFEHEVAVFFVGTGTAANSLGMAAVNRPGGVMLCHDEAHIVKDECGAPEYFTGGGRLQTVAGDQGKIDPRELRREISKFRPDFIHAGQPMAVTITQSTEVGTIYSAEEIEAIAEVCKEAKLPLHMDGARFPNALVTHGVSPAEMTWKRGIDFLSFGATKNGCWCAEALVFFNPSMAKNLPYIRKRGAQLFSKTRFIAAQFEAYFKNDLWLELAANANRQATRLHEMLSQCPDIRPAWPTEANEVFAIMPKTRASQWKEGGVGFYEWPVPNDIRNDVGEDETLVRLVGNFRTSDEEVEAFRQFLKS